MKFAVAIVAALGLSLGLSACSPEDGRKRGERGADLGNRPDNGPVLREKTDMFRGTPRKSPR